MRTMRWSAAMWRSALRIRVLCVVGLFPVGLLGDSTAELERCWCGPPLAVLVSGQLARWLWWATFARLPDGALSLASAAVPTARQPACAPAIDLFAVLDRSVQPRWLKSDSLAAVAPINAPRSAESERSAAAHAEELLAQVRPLYRALGFRNVTLSLIERAEIDARVQATLAAIAPRSAALHGQTVRGWRSSVRKHTPKYPMRVGTNGPMLWLRHAALRLALGANAGHRWFLYLRDDNVFLGAPAAPLPAFALERCNATKPVIAVDAVCGFNGGESDKVYFGNLAGASALFGATESEYENAIFDWMNVRQTPPPGVRPIRRARRPPADDPLHIEFFLSELLNARAVQTSRLPFNRFDARPIRAPIAGAGNGSLSIVGGAEEDFKNLTLCVPKLYWNVCQPRPQRTGTDVAHAADEAAAVPASPAPVVLPTSSRLAVSTLPLTLCPHV